MPSFYAMPDKLDIDSFVLRHHSVLLNNFADDIRSVDLSCLSDSVEDRIRQTVMALGASTEWGAGAMNGMSAALGDVSKLYRDTEYRILGRDPEDGSGEGSGDGFDVPDWVRDILNGLGPIGFPFSAIWDLAHGDYADFLGGIIKLVGGGIDVLRGGSWVDWLGFNALEGPWKYGLGQYFDLDSPFSTGANWLAQIITNGYNNIVEFGDDWFSNGRFWEEFVTETGISVGEDILIGAGVAAIFAAAFPEVSVPVIVVGAAAAAVTAGVNWVGNQIVTWATDGAYTSWLEWASDGICDFGEWAWDGITDGAEWIGDRISDGAEWIGDRISDGAEWVGDRISDGAEWIGDRWNDFTGGVADTFGSFCGWAFG